MMLTPKTRLWLCIGVTALFATPSLSLMGTKTHNGWLANEHRQQLSQQAQVDAEIAQDRARSCIPLDQNTPLVDGAYSHYRGHFDRPLPPHVFICDYFGNTAEVGDGGIAIDTRSAAPEVINKIISSRGLRTPAIDLAQNQPNPAPNPKSSPKSPLQK